MRRLGTRLMLGLVGSLLLASVACTDEPSETPRSPAPSTPASPSSTATSVVTTSVPEPATLLPLDATDPGGLAIVRALFTGLVTWDADSSEAVPAVAESVESSDGGTTWQVVLEDGWTFHDGTAVTARSFVDAWNHGAHGTNQRQHREAFADIQGFAALQCGTIEATERDVQAGDADEVGDLVPDCEGAPPSTEELSGLEVVSRTEFTVTLRESLPSWPQRLAAPAFLPLPPAFFEDPAGFAEEPIGNGPFRLSQRTDEAILTSAVEDHPGESDPQVDGIDFRVHPDRDAALTALFEGEVDVMTDIPAERWPETQSQVAHREATPASALNYLAFPLYDDRYADADLRAALSMAVDRELITETLFDGLRAPANNVVAPVVPRYEETVCPAWGFDPEAAKERLDEAGGLDGPITVWFNEDGGHRPWLEAVVRQWSQHLGIDASEVRFEERPYREYLQVAADEGMTGPFRVGWDMTYPHPQNYLESLLESRSRVPQGANDAGYESEEFDEALNRARSTTQLDDAVDAYQDAAAIACEDVPLMPIFYDTHTVAWNATVSNVRVDPLGVLDYTALTSAPE